MLKKIFSALNMFVMLVFASNLFALEWGAEIQTLKTSAVKSTVSMRDFLTSKRQKANFDNQVMLIILEDGTKAVFKPVPQHDLADAHAEVAAFKASQFLGFPKIPPTIIRKIKHEIGSLQLYIEPTVDSLQPEIYEETLNKVSPTDLANLKLFYFVFGQWDTGPQNLIIQKELDNIHLVAIDNSGIKHRQYVHYGELPFVRICYSDVLSTKDWHLPFPYEKVNTINDTRFEKLLEIFGDKFPKQILKNLSKYTAPLPYAIYKNSLWIQFHKADPAFVISHTTLYSKKTIDALKRLNKKELNKIFSEAQGLDFLTKDYLEAILERRDQVIKAYESINDKKYQSY